jgi:hypothetical protein
MLSLLCFCDMDVESFHDVINIINDLFLLPLELFVLLLMVIN